MASIPQVAGALRSLLVGDAERIAREAGFQVRRRKLTGPVFAQALVYGWLADPEASLHDLARTAALPGADVTPRALDRRFTPEAAEFLRRLLAEAVGRPVAARPAAVPVLRRFAAVVALDATAVGLPAAPAGDWPGEGAPPRGPRAAGIKLAVGLDLNSGRLHGPEPQPARQPGVASPLAAAPPPRGPCGWPTRASGTWRRWPGWAATASPGSRGRSPGRPSSPPTAAAGGRPGTCWGRGRPTGWRRPSSRESASTALPADRRAGPARGGRGPAGRLPATTRRGSGAGSPPRRRRCAEWTALVTDAPAAKLSAAEALVLRRARWQIELLFELWKSHGGIDFMADLRPAAGALRGLRRADGDGGAALARAPGLLGAAGAEPDEGGAAGRPPRPGAGRGGPGGRLREAVRAVAACLRTGCRMNPRRAAPNTYQLLLGLSPGP